MKPLDDLEHTDCRWPIGDPKKAGFGFCGEPRQHGKPYCAAHCKLAYMPRRAEPWVPGAKNFNGETKRGGFVATAVAVDGPVIDCVESFARGGVR